MLPSARFYNCARCHQQVVICRHCDRGHIYCRHCAALARRTAQRDAKRRYQRTRQGRFNNAQRQRRFRERQRQNVTDQGSIPLGPSALLPTARPQAIQHPSGPGFNGNSVIHCHFCGCQCSPFLRRAPRRRCTFGRCHSS